MAYTKIIEITNADEARERIDYAFLYFRDQVNDALKYLNDHVEPWPASVVYHPNEYGADSTTADIDGTRLKTAKNYETMQIAMGKPVDPEVKQRADDFVRDFDARNAGIVRSFEEENVVDGDPITAYESYNTLLRELEAYEDDKNAGGTWREIVKDINERTEFAKGKELELSDTLWQTVKTNILRNRTLSKDWQDSMRAGTTKDFLKEEIYSAYLTEAEIQSKALEVPEPEGKEKEIGSQEHANFLAGIYGKAKEIFNDLSKKGKKLKINEQSAVVGAAEAYAKFNEFTRYLRAKRDALGKRIYGFKLVKDAQDYATKLDKNMEQKHPKLWNKFKNYALRIRASKYRIKHYAVGVAIVGAAGLVSAGAGTVALGLFSAYTAVGAWVYPIVERKQMELIKARKENPKEARKWEGKAGFMRAFEATLFKENETDENGEPKINWREASLYFVKGVIGSAASLAVMDMATNWFGSGKALSDAVTNSTIGHWMQKMIHVPEAAAAQAFATFNRAIVRTVGAIVPSLASVAGDTTSLAVNAVTMNKEGIKRSWQNLQGSLTGLALVSAISGVSLVAQAAITNHQFAPDSTDANATTGAKASKLAEQTQQPAEQSDAPVTSWKSGKGLTTVEENGKLVIKDADGKVIESQDTKNIEDWANKTDKDKAKYVQAYMNSTQGAIDDQAVLNNFKDFLPTKNGNAFIPTNAEEAGMTEHEWKVFNQRLVGIIGTQEGAEHIGVAQLDTGAVREEALMNLMKFMKANPDAFPAGSNPLKILDSGLESHYYSVGHGYFDGDGHWIAEKYKWVEIDGKEVEVMGRFAKVGDGDTYGRVTGDYLRLNGQKLPTYAKIGDTDTYGRVSGDYLIVGNQKLKIEDGVITLNGKQEAIERGYAQVGGEMTKFETGYAKVGDQMVQFDGKSDITIGNDSYTVGSKWIYGDSSNEAQMNTFMNIICGKKYNAGDVATMGAAISKLNAAAAHAYATGEGNNAVGVGRNCDEVTVFKFAKKHTTVVHHDTPVVQKEEASGTTTVADVATKKEVSGTTTVTDEAVQKDQGSHYVAVRRRGVNSGTTDNLPGSKSMKGHDKVIDVTVIKPQKSY